MKMIYHEMSLKILIHQKENPHHQYDVHSLGLSTRQFLMIQMFQVSEGQAKSLMRLKNTIKLSAAMLSC